MLIKLRIFLSCPPGPPEHAIIENLSSAVETQGVLTNGGSPSCALLMGMLENLEQ